MFSNCTRLGTGQFLRPYPLSHRWFSVAGYTFTLYHRADHPLLRNTVILTTLLTNISEFLNAKRSPFIAIFENSCVNKHRCCFMIPFSESDNYHLLHHVSFAIQQFKVSFNPFHLRSYFAFPLWLRKYKAARRFPSTGNHGKLATYHQCYSLLLHVFYFVIQQDY